MDFDPGTAILAGLVATAVMTALMYAGASMMSVRMDMPMMLGTMMMPPGSAARMAGLVMHFVAGTVFFIIYAALFDAFGIDSTVAGWAALFGLVHGVLAGLMMVMMPMMHSRMATAGAVAGSGEVEAPGLFGKNLGQMAPMAIVALHVVFGLVGGAIYAA
ncbi:MAG: hypothetical protein Kow0010_25980 [Dehalococcoidia bacterium]